MPRAAATEPCRAAAVQTSAHPVHEPCVHRREQESTWRFEGAVRAPSRADDGGGDEHVDETEQAEEYWKVYAIV